MHITESIPLELLSAGQWAEIISVLGKAEWVGRLAELGIQSGVNVQMLRPGNPCLLLIGSSRLSLRGEATMSIMVRPQSAFDAST